MREALAEARFLQSVEEDETRSRGKVFTVKEEVKPVEEPKVDLNQVVETCIKQLQALQANKKQSERPRSAQKRLRCWCCRDEGHLMRACPVVQQNKAAYCKQVADKQGVPDSARRCQRVSESTRGCQMMQNSFRGCQMVPKSARGCQRVPDGTRGCQMVSEDARGCHRVPDGVRGCQMVPDGTRECQRVPEGARWCQWVPDGARRCQRDQIGTVVARGLGKASVLIFVKVSIAGVEVDALVDTGATTSCCRWDWYQKWKDHLGDLIKSKVRIIGVGHNPIKIKGLTRPLTLHWDGVGGKFQLIGP